MSDTYITNQPVIPPNQNDVAAWKQAYIDLYALGREATDDYLQACARITELEQEQIALWHTINTQATYAEELEAQSAQRWEPVNEKFILTYDTGLVDTPKQFVRWNADDESVIVGKDDGSFHHCPLPDDIRLCRLVEKGEGHE